MIGTLWEAWRQTIQSVMCHAEGTLRSCGVYIWQGVGGQLGPLGDEGRPGEILSDPGRQSSLSKAEVHF